MLLQTWVTYYGHCITERKKNGCEREIIYGEKGPDRMYVYYTSSPQPVCCSALMEHRGMGIIHPSETSRHAAVWKEESMTKCYLFALQTFWKSVYNLGILLFKVNC